MRNFLSSLIDRNQRPQTEIRPRLGSLFEPSPLVGAPVQAGQETDSPSQMASRPPSTTVPETLPAPEPHASLKPRPDAEKPMDLPRLRVDPPGLPAQTVGRRDGQDEAIRQSQRAVRPISPPAQPSSQNAPPVRSTTFPERDLLEPQVRSQTVEPASPARPVAVALHARRHEAPPKEGRSDAPDQGDRPAAPHDADWMARLAATVSSPAASTIVNERPSLPRGEQKFATIRPEQIAPPGTDPRAQAGSTRNASPNTSLPGQGNPPEPPIIRVSIGRIEVRANVPEPPRPRPLPGQSARRQPALSLSDYLKQRGGRP